MFISNLTSREKAEITEKALIALGELIILDATGHLIYISKEYAKNMHISMEDSIGRHILEVIPDSKLPEVLKTGQPILGAMYYRDNNAFWVNRIPIKENGKTVGVVAQSMLTNDLSSEKTKRQLNAVIRELNFYKEKYNRMSTSRYSLDTIISRSPSMEDLKETVRHIANTRSTVLLTGESGTGKEVFAGAIHNLSSRSNRPFVKINCAAIPDTLLESELFGYKEGAFTGAIKGGKIGDFEAANGGTLFLDEVDSLSPNMQAKLLRVIQEREIKKIGSTETIPIDVRFIFATNKNLLKAVRENTFREDFYYRINVINLLLPPLRDRPEDIEPLIRHYIKKFNDEFSMNISGIEPEALAILENYKWPGNIRELENCIERAFNYATSNTIRPEDIYIPEKASISSHRSGFSLKTVREQAEKRAIMQALSYCNDNKTEAAAYLGIDRSILYDKIKKYGLS